MYVLMLKPNTINIPPMKPYHGLYVSHDFRVKIITKPAMFAIWAIVDHFSSVNNFLIIKLIYFYLFAIPCF